MTASLSPRAPPLSRMTPLLNQQPRYLQLAQTLINEIRSGRYAVGAFLPTEYDLCEQFGASRHTVREAVRRLVQMGLVDRQPGVGTRVLAREAVSGYQQVMRQLNDLHQYTADTELTLLRRDLVEVDDALAKVLRASHGETWLHLEGVRTSGNEVDPICVSDIYIHPAFRAVEVEGHSHTPIYALIEQQFGEQIAAVQQEIRATLITAAQARLLNTQARSPALWICRRYLNRREEVVEAAISIHPSERFSYLETFQRDWRAT
ncbi:GntR family transcriptional regulator [Paraburkholderia piptadeniae]|uniref:GntR family transcriptional regulator n=2 Tax=Paraburkholderia piptadeniae TaxID=1701573 RepID=A0A1N7RIS7_9BURK|nr:GntR family transcriptional regulator [Paraburkholderia piptadeniae]